MTDRALSSFTVRDTNFYRTMGGYRRDFKAEVVTYDGGALERPQVGATSTTRYSVGTIQTEVASIDVRVSTTLAIVGKSTAGDVIISAGHPSIRNEVCRIGVVATDGGDLSIEVYDKDGNPIFAKTFYR
jgi:hypothetical protein